MKRLLIAVAVLVLSTAAHADWINYPLPDGCSMRNALDDPSTGLPTVAVTFTPGSPLKFQLFRTKWLFGGRGAHDPNPIIKIQFGGNNVDFWLRAPGYAHFVAGQGILTVPIAYKNAKDFIQSLDNAEQFTVQFFDGSGSWLSITPSNSDAFDKFASCVRSLGGIVPTAFDRGGPF